MGISIVPDSKSSEVGNMVKDLIKAATAGAGVYSSLNGRGEVQPQVKVSQNVNTQNNASNVLGHTLQISVGGNVGPAETSPTSLLYPGSQSLSAAQNDVPAYSPSLNGQMLNTSLPPVVKQQAAASAGFDLSPEMILLALGAFFLFSMPGGKGKGA